MRTWVLALGLTAVGGCVVYDGPVVQAPPGPPVTRDEAERLAAAGISEPVVVELVEKRGARPLTADDLVALKKAGAGDAVVQKMIASETRVPETAVVYDPAYYYYPYSPYSYYWGPSWGFSFGYGYYPSHHHHPWYRFPGGYRRR